MHHEAPGRGGGPRNLPAPRLLQLQAADGGGFVGAGDALHHDRAVAPEAEAIPGQRGACAGDDAGRPGPPCRGPLRERWDHRERGEVEHRLRNGVRVQPAGRARSNVHLERQHRPGGRCAADAFGSSCRAAAAAAATSGRREHGQRNRSQAPHEAWGQGLSGRQSRKEVGEDLGSLCAVREAAPHRLHQRDTFDRRGIGARRRFRGGADKHIEGVLGG
mmetsp:Transcript_25523/g.73732  ORF Transcript_25523/g.73732 Transcript_25523/m.73732 type:complete len:218 (-) Transcript_25523:435-1088(-)